MDRNPSAKCRADTETDQVGALLDREIIEACELDLARSLLTDEIVVEQLNRLDRKKSDGAVSAHDRLNSLILSLCDDNLLTPATSDFIVRTLQKARSVDDIPPIGDVKFRTKVEIIIELDCLSTAKGGYENRLAAHEKECERIRKKYPDGPEYKYEYNWYDDEIYESSYLVGEFPNKPEREYVPEDLKKQLLYHVKLDQIDRAGVKLTDQFVPWVDSYGLDSTLRL